MQCIDSEVASLKEAFHSARSRTEQPVIAMDKDNEDAIPLLPVSSGYSDPPAYARSSPSPPPQPQPQPQMGTSLPVQYRPAASSPTPYPQTGYPQTGISQMSSNNNTVVVTGAPSQLPPVMVTQPSDKPTQHILVLSLVLIAVCSLTCQVWSLFLLIPGVIFAVVGYNYRHSHKPNKRQTGRGLYGVSLCCSVTTLVSFVMVVLCTILFVAIFYGRLQSKLSNYYPTYDYCSSSQCRFSCGNDIYGSCYQRCINNYC
ncbi:uncharacterized protein LOC135351499 isoform X2 [Halichondria panicea]|uniref:uncharacterized protein LOC135351499 isoform X2 n=1 Tax=Halichondria panicea TaxID=6063 RepID=UPI00312BA95C